jgi:hypothetical protein
MVKLIIRLKDEKISGRKITSAKEFQAAHQSNTKGAKANQTQQDASIKKTAAIVSAPVSSASLSDSASLDRDSSSSSSSSSSSPSFPFIFGLGCCVPGPGAPQAAIMDVMVSDMELPPKKAAMFTKIGESAGIDRRFSCLPSIEAIYFGRKGLGNNGPHSTAQRACMRMWTLARSVWVQSLTLHLTVSCICSSCPSSENVEVRNAIFKSEAPALSLDSARAAIADWGGDQADITHVVAVTCTGVIVPGLEFQILSGLGLSANTQRLSVTFMGCLSGHETTGTSDMGAEDPLVATPYSRLSCVVTIHFSSVQWRTQRYEGSPCIRDGEVSWSWYTRDASCACLLIVTDCIPPSSCSVASVVRPVPRIVSCWCVRSCAVCTCNSTIASTT